MGKTALNNGLLGREVSDFFLWGVFWFNSLLESFSKYSTYDVASQELYNQMQYSFNAILLYIRISNIAQMNLLINLKSTLTKTNDDPHCRKITGFYLVVHNIIKGKFVRWQTSEAEWQNACFMHPSFLWEVNYYCSTSTVQFIIAIDW